MNKYGRSIRGWGQRDHMCTRRCAAPPICERLSQMETTECGQPSSSHGIWVRTRSRCIRQGDAALEAAAHEEELDGLLLVVHGVVDPVEQPYTISSCSALSLYISKKIAGWLLRSLRRGR